MTLVWTNGSSQYFVESGPYTVDKIASERDRWSYFAWHRAGRDTTRLGGPFRSSEEAKACCERHAEGAES